MDMLLSLVRQATFFLPAGVVGINAKSSQQEEAKLCEVSPVLLKYRLSIQGLGMPVNKKTFEQLCQIKDSSLGGIAVISSDSSYSINLTFPANLPRRNMTRCGNRRRVGNSGDPGYYNPRCSAAVRSSLSGRKLELNDAVQEILKKVALYLSE